MGIITNENKIPESFSSIKSKMNSRIKFTIEMMNEALEDICKNKELYSAKDRLKATQDYLALFIRLENEIQKEIEHKETMKHRKLTTKIKQHEVNELEDNQITSGLTPINQSKFSPTIGGSFS